MITQKMQLLTIILLFLAPQMVSAFSEVMIAPEMRIRLSALSERILLVDIKKIDREPAIAENGIESRKLVLSGSILEVVRGSKNGNKYESSCIDVIIVDEAAYKKANHGVVPPDFLRSQEISVKTGAADVKQGGRYLVITYEDRDYFIPIAPQDNSWREKLLGLRDSTGKQKSAINGPAESQSEHKSKPEIQSEGRSRL